MKGLVVDTSVLYYGKDLPDGYELLITPGVVRELNKEGMGDRLELLLATKLRISAPSQKSLERIEAEAEKTGDSRRLSETDKELLALALELRYELVTDDYSMQNLARVIGIPCRGDDQKGITQVFQWHARCKGCGKLFPPDVRVCDVCGSETKSSRKRQS